jgi:2',3'-cyclic-nucleotide 2'-phosphodiesterase (5'-nucleotidase family)
VIVTLFAWLVLANPPLPTEPEEASTVHLVVTGGTQGLGGARYRLSDVQALGVGDITSLNAHYGTLVRGSTALVTEGRTAAEASLLLGDGEVSCDTPRQAKALFTSTEALLWDAADGTPPAGDWREEPWSAHDCVSPSGVKAVAFTGPYSEAPTTLEGFEWRLSVHLMVRQATAPIEEWSQSDRSVTSIEMIGRPDEDAARRIHLVREALSEDPSALFIDAGGFIDGFSSVKDDSASLHRPTGLRLLHELKPAALVPGPHELAFGSSALVRDAEGLPYVAANILLDERSPFPPMRSLRVPGPQQDLKIAVIGVASAPHTEMAREQWVDPVSSVQAVVDGLDAQHPHDLVIVAGAVDPMTLRRLQHQLRGVDILLTDTGPRADRSETLTYTLRSRASSRRISPVTLPLHGVLDATITFEAGEARQIIAHTRPVTTEVAPDLSVLRAINDVRRTSYPSLDAGLIDVNPEDPIGRVDEDHWFKLICESIRQDTHADVALFPSLPTAPDIPGPLTELMVVNRLALPDRLVVHRIHGDRLIRLLDKAWGAAPITCGAPLGSKSPKIAGRPVEAERVYRLVTTDTAESIPAIRSLLEESHATGLLDQPVKQRVLDAQGSQRTLRAAALDALRKQRQLLGSPVLQAPGLQEGERSDLWLARVRALSLSVEDFDGTDDPRYADLPETMATSPSSFTLAYMADLALERNTQHTMWDLRSRMAFTQLKTEDDEQEPADDWQTSTSVSLPGMEIPGPLPSMPYLETLYDTEFTPVEDEEGQQLPKQKDLSLTAGVSVIPTPSLRRLRIGVFVLRDLSPETSSTESGLRADAEIKKSLAPGVTWTTWTDTYLFANVPDAGSDDLRFKLTTETRVQSTLARWLAAGVYARSFLFAGQVPQTRAVGHAWTMGASLDLTGAFRLSER